MTPFFSIITPTFNRAGFLPITIESILNQTYDNWELIIVDDGSTDDTKEVVLNYKNEKIKYIYQENRERSAARNNGINNARGNYFLFVDSDDQLFPDTLQKLYEAISLHKFPVAIFGTKLLYHENDKEVASQIALNEDVNLIKILENKGTIPVSQCAHKYCFLKHRFDPRFTIWEDTHLWLRIISGFKCHGVPEARIHVSRHGLSTVSQGLQVVKLQDVHRYKEAVMDLLNYPDLSPSNLSGSLIKDYIFSKYQMYIYQARQNRQHDLAYTLLKEALTFKKDTFYCIKTYLKLLWSNCFKYHLS